MDFDLIIISGLVSIVCWGIITIADRLKKIQESNELQVELLAQIVSSLDDSETDESA